MKPLHRTSQVKTSTRNCYAGPAHVGVGFHNRCKYHDTNRSFPRQSPANETSISSRESVTNPWLGLSASSKPRDVSQAHRLSVGQRLDLGEWLLELDLASRELDVVVLVGQDTIRVDLRPASVEEIALGGAVVEVLGSKDDAGDGLGEEGDGDVLGAGVVVHAEVEPQDNILIIDALAVEELGEVLLGLGSQVDVLEGVGDWLVVVLASDGEVRLEHGGGLGREGGVLDREGDVAAAGDNAVTALLTPGVGLALVDDRVHGLVVGGPVEHLLLLHVALLELHLLEDAELGEPGLALVGDGQLGNLEGVLLAENVEVGLEVEDVGVVAALGGLVDTGTEAALGLVVGGGLKVAGGADLNLHGTIEVEGVVEEVVVVADCVDEAEVEGSILDGGEVAEAVGGATAVAVTSKREASVSLEDAESTRVDACLAIGGVGDVEHGGAEGAVVTLNQSRDSGTEAVVGVMIDGVGGLGCVTGILSSGLLHLELVENALALELDIVEGETKSAGEGKVEGPAHVLDILLLEVDLVTLATDLDVLGSHAVLERPGTHLGLVFDKSPLLVAGLGELVLDLTGIESLAELGSCLKVLLVGDKALELVVGHVGAADIEKDVEVEGSQVGSLARIPEHHAAVRGGAVERLRIGRGDGKVGARVTGAIPGTVKQGNKNVVDLLDDREEEVVGDLAALGIEVARVVGNSTTIAAVVDVVELLNLGLVGNGERANHIFLGNRLRLATLEDDGAGILWRKSTIAIDVGKDSGLVGS